MTTETQTVDRPTSTAAPADDAAKAAVDRRLNAFHAMTPDTQAVARQFDLLLARENRGVLLTRHDLGTRLKQVILEEARYGSYAVRHLAAYLGQQPDALYKLRTFAEVFTRAQVEQWSARRTAAGGRVGFSHLAAVMVVRSAVERARLVELAFAESLSVRELEEAVRAGGHEKRKDSKGGRRPGSIAEGLEQLIRRGGTMLKGFPVWERVVFEPIRRASAEERDQGLVLQLMKARQLLENLAEQIGPARETIERRLRAAQLATEPAGDPGSSARISRPSDEAAPVSEPEPAK